MMKTGYRDLTVGDLLTALARDVPQQEALVYPQRRWTFEQLEEDALRLARGLLAVGLRGGDRVAVWAPNVAEWVLLQFALAKIGSVLVTVNTQLQAREMAYLLSQSECRGLFMADGFRDLNYRAIMDEVRGISELPRLEFVFRMADVADLMERGVGATMRCSVGLDDVINMQYTSGTTGFPKGVMLSSRNIVNNGYWLGEALAFTQQDRLCLPVPLFHCFGCVIGVLGAYTHGTCLVPLESFDPLQALRSVAEERCTALYGVPTMFLAELEHAEFSRFDLRTLRTGIMAGALCPEALMRRVMEQMHAREIIIAYGLTEASPGITCTDRHDTLENRTQTVGRPMPDVEVTITDGDCEVPRGAAGELCARGYNIMLGYYNKPEETAQALDADGWLHTGDQATMDAAGYVRITGRIKEIIIRGGENISPREVEDVLRAHPSVLDVCVYGVACEKYGEEVAAAVRLREGTSIDHESVKQFCEGKMAPFKVPRRVRVVEEFPMTASGKIQRYRLRELG